MTKTEIREEMARRIDAAKAQQAADLCPTCGAYWGCECPLAVPLITGVTTDGISYFVEMADSRGPSKKFRYDEGADEWAPVAESSQDA